MEREMELLFLVNQQKAGKPAKHLIDRGPEGGIVSTSRYAHVCDYMSYNLNSLKGGYVGDYIWDYYRGY